MKFEKLILYFILSLLFVRGIDAGAAEPDSLLIRFSDAELQGDSASILSALYDIGIYYDSIEAYDSAAIFYNRGIRIADSITAKAPLANLQNRLGNIHLIWGNYRKALDLYLESLKICKEINDSIGISRALNNIGIIYSDWGEKEISLEYYQRSLEVDSLLHDLLGQSKTLNNIAILFDEMGEKERALRYYFRSLGLAALKENHNMIAVTTSNIGGYYLEIKDYELAADFYFKSLEEYKLDRSVNGQAEAYINIGNLYRATKEFSAAVDYYKQGLDIVVPKNLNTAIMNAYDGMYNVYIEQRNYREALSYLEKYHYLKDSIFSIETSSELASLVNAYEMQQKDNEMELQEARVNEQKAVIRRQQNVLFSLLGLVVISFVFSIMLIRQYRLRMRAWKQLLVQHEEILENRKELIKAKEKAEESDRLKTTFLVNVSHELRTPMNGIMGFTDLLQRGKATEDQNKLYLSYIASSSRQLLKVLNDIIDISSIETKQIRIEPEKHHLTPVFEDLLEYFQKEKVENGKENIDISYIMPEHAAEHHCMIDKKRFAQVLFNLLNNALRFTTEGSIQFGYNILENNTLQVFVKDTGIGIERSNFELIFERFRQVDDSTTRQIGGSGLGLAISRELVKLMNGRIYVKSELEVGSTFFFEIPYIPAG